MKRINFLLIVLLIAGTAIFTSCKKETRIERSLWNKGGEWNVEKLYNKQTSSNPDPSYNFEETLYDYGTYSFDKDGSGGDRKSTRLNSSHVRISYAVFCLK